METKTQLVRTGEQETEKIPQKIRAELNLEKWAIFLPAKSRTKPSVRIIEREITSPDGRKGKGTLQIGTENVPAKITTTDQRLLYILTKNWEDKGKRTGLVFFSLQQIAKMLGMKWSPSTKKYLTKSLFTVRFAPLIWKETFFNSTTGKSEPNLDTFTFLSKLKISERKTDGHKTVAFGYYQFHELLLANLLNNYTKPKILDTVLNFKSEIAQMLYTYIDLILANETYRERRSKELFDEFGLTGKEYRKPSARKRKLENALHELQGVPLSNGGVLSVAIKKTADEEDYKICFRKSTAKAKALNPADPQPEDRGEATAGSLSDATARTSPQPQQAEIATDPTAPTRTEAKDLVLYFHRTFHKIEMTHIESEELNKATVLIARYGYEKAAYIVDYLKREAPKTGFNPQHFGSLMSYAERAKADFERFEKERKEREKEEAERERYQQALAVQRKKAEAMLESLPQETYQKLYNDSKDDLKRRHPSLFSTARPNNEVMQKSIEAAIKAGMIDTLTYQIPLEIPTSLQPAAQASTPEATTKQTPPDEIATELL